MDSQVKIVIGNKSDKSKKRQVTQDDIKRFTKDTGINVVETSAKLGTQIEEAFLHLTKEMMKVKTEKGNAEYSGARLESNPPSKNESCC